MRPNATLIALLSLASCQTDLNVSKGQDDTDNPDVVDTDVAETDTPDTDVVDTATVDTDVADTDVPGDDRDHDTVPNRDDVCDGQDDRVDLNADATPDCAQNLLSNGQVTTGLTGWADERIGSNLSTATFSTDDASAWPYSGSLHVVNETAANMANASGVYGACVAANPGDSFDVWYHYTVPTGGGDGPQFITSFDVYTDSVCGATAASTTPGPPATTIGGGWHVMHMGSPITMWPQWRSFRVRIELYKPGMTAPLTFGLDDVLVLGLQ